MTSRRQFLKRTGGVMTLAVGGLQIACSVEESRQIESADLSDGHMLILVGILQHILPHENLDAQVYIDAVTTLADRAARDAGFKQMLIDGASGLDQKSSWLDLPDAEQIALLKTIENGEFFKTLQTTALEQVYRDERAWNLVGYEGEAIKFGGYVNRGFNDIDWLPDADSGGSN